MQHAECGVLPAFCIRHSALLQSVPLSLFPERLPADAEEPRRFGLVSARQAQRGGDVAPFHLVQRRTPRLDAIGLEGSRVENLARQMIQPDRAGVILARGGEAALDGVPKLAPV